MIISRKLPERLFTLVLEPELSPPWDIRDLDTQTIVSFRSKEDMANVAVMEDENFIKWVNSVPRSVGAAKPNSAWSALRVDSRQCPEIEVGNFLMTFRFDHVKDAFQALPFKTKRHIREAPYVWRTGPSTFFFLVEDDTKIITSEPIWLHLNERVIYFKVGGREWFLKMTEECRAKFILGRIGYDVSRDEFVATSHAVAECGRPTEGKPSGYIIRGDDSTRMRVGDFDLDSKLRQRWKRGDAMPVVIQYRPNQVLFFRNHAERWRFSLLSVEEQKEITRAAVRLDKLESVVRSDELLSSCT